MLFPMESSGSVPGNLFARLRRRTAMIVVLALVLFVIAAWQILSLTPRYSAEALIRINDRQTRITTADAVVGSLDGDIETVQSEVQVLRSPDLVEAVVRRLNLQNSSEFNLALRAPGLYQSWLAAATALVEERAIALKLYNPAVAVEEPARDPILDAEQVVLSHLVVEPAGRSRVIKISMSSSSAVLSAKIIDTLCDLYLQRQVTAKEQVAQKAHAVLDTRIAELTSQTTADDEAVENYQIKLKLYRLGDSSLAMQQLGTLTNGLAEARAASNEASARLAAAQSYQGGAAVPETLQNRLIQELTEDYAKIHRDQAAAATRYGSNHPVVEQMEARDKSIRDKIGNEVAKVTVGLQEQVSIAQARVADMTQQIADVTTEINRYRQADVALRELERRADASRNLLQELLKRQQEVVVQQDTQFPDGSIVSRANGSNRPSFPKTKLLLAISVPLCAGFSLLCGYILESRRKGLWSAGEVRERYGIPCLALIPRLSSSARRNPAAYVLKNPRSSYAEAVNRINAAVEREVRDERGVIALVTSAEAGEGKSSLVMAMARMAANSGRRVIVLDSDMRSSGISTMLGLQSGAGLSEFLSNEHPLQGVIQRDPASSVHVMRAGLSHGLSSMLGRPPVANRLLALKQVYDLIIIDSCATTVVSDALSLAGCADCVVFLAQWAATPHDVIASELRSLAEAGARRIGVALNGVQLTSGRDRGSIRTANRAYYLN